MLILLVFRRKMPARRLRAEDFSSYFSFCFAFKIYHCVAVNNQNDYITSFSKLQAPTYYIL